MVYIYMYMYTVHLVLVIQSALKLCLHTRVLFVQKECWVEGDGFCCHDISRGSKILFRGGAKYQTVLGSATQVHVLYSIIVANTLHPTVLGGSTVWAWPVSGLCQWGLPPIKPALLLQTMMVTRQPQSFVLAGV